MLLATVLNRNLDTLRDLGFDVVPRRDLRRRKDAALALALDSRQCDVEVQRAVDRSQCQTDGAAGAISTPRLTRC